MKKKLKLLIVAGENSGDAHAADLVEAFREKYETEFEFEFFGTTGPQMRAAGVRTVFEADEFSVVGVPEVLRAVPMFWQVFKGLKRAAALEKPDAVILIDFPEFNLKLAKSLKKKGLKIIYYISPQLWAWRKYRLRGIKKYVDLLLTIMPFEKNWYENQRVGHVEYVGNPLAGKVKSVLTRAEFCEKHGLEKSAPVVALLGGSRRKELEHILPVLLDALPLLYEKNNKMQFVLALSSTSDRAAVDERVQKLTIENPRLRDKIVVVKSETFEALNASDAAAVTSGTATLETAIIGTPLVIVYKTSEINYRLIKPLINLEHYGLVNLIAERPLAKELIQSDFTPENLAREILRLLEPENNRKMRAELLKIEKSLGEGDSSARAAEKILECLGAVDISG